MFLEYAMLGSRLALFVYAPFVCASSMDMLGSTLYIYIYIYMAVRQFARTLCHLVRGPVAPHKVGVHKVGLHKVGGTRLGKMWFFTVIP